MSTIHSLDDLDRANILAAWALSESMTMGQFMQLCLVTARYFPGVLSSEPPSRPWAA